MLIYNCLPSGMAGHHSQCSAWKVSVSLTFSWENDLNTRWFSIIAWLRFIDQVLKASSIFDLLRSAPVECDIRFRWLTSVMVCRTVWWTNCKDCELMLSSWKPQFCFIKKTMPSIVESTFISSWKFNSLSSYHHDRKTNCLVGKFISFVIQWL